MISAAGWTRTVSSTLSEPARTARRTSRYFVCARDAADGGHVARQAQQGQTQAVEESLTERNRFESCGGFVWLHPSAGLNAAASSPSVTVIFVWASIVTSAGAW